jgi:hypothetical protein
VNGRLTVGDGNSGLHLLGLSLLLVIVITRLLLGGRIVIRLVVRLVM